MLNKVKNRKEQGFTIIEVLIVLAIAGLIMLVVFLAVPALQRNARNTQRKSDVSTLLGAVTEFSNNKDGKLPGYWDTGTGEFEVVAADAAGTGVVPKLGFYKAADITLASNNTAIGTVDVNKVYVNIGGKCNATGDNVGGAGATSRSVAATYTIETSGGTTSKCQDS